MSIRKLSNTAWNLLYYIQPDWKQEVDVVVDIEATADGLMINDRPDATITWDEIAEARAANGLVSFDADEFEQYQREQWQDISTAPMDGTRVLIYVPQFDAVFACAFEYGVWQTGIWESKKTAVPTLWMPIPAVPPLPAQSKGENDE